MSELSLHSILHDCANALLDEQQHVEAGEVVLCAQQRYGDVFIAEQERLVFQAAARIAKSIMRDMAMDDDDQLSLPGINLPSAIAVPHENEDGYYYVRTDKACWSELEAGRELRVSNVRRAQQKLDQYDEALLRLQPIMEHEPDLTVADAVERLS